MSSAAGRPPREDVLDAFSVELRPDGETLERYLRAYPDYAEDLVDLSRELSRDLCDDEAPLSVEDRALIDAAWRRHAADPAPKVVADPFAALSTDDLREVARQLDVPRQIVTAFRERRVILSSVPPTFSGPLGECGEQLRRHARSTLVGARSDTGAGAQLQGGRETDRCRAGELRAVVDRCGRPRGRARRTDGGRGLTWTGWSYRADRAEDERRCS